MPPPGISSEEAALIDAAIEEAFEQIDEEVCVISDFSGFERTQMPEATPTLLIVETTAGEPPVEFLGDTAGIVYFISMAHGERYGADHPLAKAASIIRRRMRIAINPLLNFGDARADSSEEADLLERLWQDAAPLAEAARATAAAIEETPELRELTSAFPELPDRLRELAEMADWAAAQGAQVRLTYAL